MADAAQLDRTCHFILETFVTTGQAPHYTDIASAFSVEPEEGKEAAARWTGVKEQS